jgi:hypothetical protein
MYKLTKPMSARPRTEFVSLERERERERERKRERV